MSKNEEKASDLNKNEAGAKPGNTGNEISESVNKNKKSDVATETKFQREVYEKNKEIEELKRELEDAKSLHASKEQPSTAPDMALINELQGQIKQLSQQVMGAAAGKKLMFRSPVASDVLPPEEAITFTARSVVYIVASYLDKNGIEQLPPHKLIVFEYAASEIRKDGREEEIKNFSQYTTNLKTEIEFLRASPYYGITFSENTNEMANEDPKEAEFKVRAANMIQTATPEAIFQRADEFKIPNWRSKSAAELKPLVVAEMTKQYKSEAQQLQDEIIRRQFLRSAALQEKE